MPNITYHWQRFWCERDSPIRIDEQGYVADPNGPFGYALNPYVIPFEAIASLPCLVLLGEPGMGKSTALQSQFEDAQRQARISDHKALWFDLRQFQTDVRLAQVIFAHPEMRSWAAGSQRLYLFLDGLDECLLHIKTVAALLTQELTQQPADRLMLRIACRSAEWPKSLEDALLQHWGNEHVGIYDLVPLRRRDVAAAAATSNLAVDPFLAEVERAGAVPLAIKPITLDFLIKTYRRNGRLPARQAKLYTEGCRLLCEEHNPSRRESGLVGTLSADQRLRIAERIA